MRRIGHAVCVTLPSKQLMALCVQVVEKQNGRADGSVMILVTSGADEHITNCLLTAMSSGSTIHSMALGSSAARNLGELSHVTGNRPSKQVSFRAYS